MSGPFVCDQKKSLVSGSLYFAKAGLVSYPSHSRVTHGRRTVRDTILVPRDTTESVSGYGDPTSGTNRTYETKVITLNLVETIRFVGVP